MNKNKKLILSGRRTSLEGLDTGNRYIRFFNFQNQNNTMNFEIKVQSLNSKIYKYLEMQRKKGEIVDRERRFNPEKHFGRRIG